MVSACDFLSKHLDISHFLLSLYLPSLFKLLIAIVLAFFSFSHGSTSSTILAMALYIFSFLLESCSHGSSGIPCIIRLLLSSLISRDVTLFFKLLFSCSVFSHFHFSCFCSFFSTFIFLSCSNCLFCTSINVFNLSSRGFCTSLITSHRHSIISGVN